MADPLDPYSVVRPDEYSQVPRHQLDRTGLEQLIALLQFRGMLAGHNPELGILPPQTPMPQVIPPPPTQPPPWLKLPAEFGGR